MVKVAPFRSYVLLRMRAFCPLAAAQRLWAFVAKTHLCIYGDLTSNGIRRPLLPMKGGWPSPIPEVFFRFFGKTLRLGFNPFA